VLLRLIMTSFIVHTDRPHVHGLFNVQGCTKCAVIDENVQ